MHADANNQYRHLLELDSPAFVDRVDNPWDQIPDLDSYNAKAFRKIQRDLSRIDWACQTYQEKGGTHERLLPC